jgi:hypothetical protein
MALAELVGDPQPDWELTAARLAHAVAVHPGAFLDKSRFSMDWYYPVLGGAVRGAAGLSAPEPQVGRVRRHRDGEPAASRTARG